MPVWLLLWGVKRLPNRGIDGQIIHIEAELPQQLKGVD